MARPGRSKMRAAMYCRIAATVKTTGRVSADQEQDCKELCEAEGWEIVGLYIDNDAQCANPDRAGLQYERMVREMEDGAFDVIVGIGHGSTVAATPRARGVHPNL